MFAIEFDERCCGDFPRATFGARLVNPICFQGLLGYAALRRAPLANFRLHLPVHKPV
jgi:hypothetical protein